jgi:hypothetical protein
VTNGFADPALDAAPARAHSFEADLEQRCELFVRRSGTPDGIVDAGGRTERDRVKRRASSLPLARGQWLRSKRLCLGESWRGPERRYFGPFVVPFQNHQVLETPGRVQVPSNKALGTHRRFNGDFVIDGLRRQRRGCRHL